MMVDGILCHERLNHENHESSKCILHKFDKRSNRVDQKQIKHKSRIDIIFFFWGSWD